jgi:hypothetical protein
MSTLQVDSAEPKDLTRQPAKKEALLSMVFPLQTDGHALRDSGLGQLLPRHRCTDKSILLHDDK